MADPVLTFDLNLDDLDLVLPWLEDLLLATETFEAADSRRFNGMMV
jgi:hypothetical protein